MRTVKEIENDFCKHRDELKEELIDVMRSKLKSLELDGVVVRLSDGKCGVIIPSVEYSAHGFFSDYKFYPYTKSTGLPSKIPNGFIDSRKLEEQFRKKV